MSTHPYVPLYVDDYEAATAHLTAEEDGVYSRLLRLSWRTPGCSLPNDPAWLARKIRLSAEDFDRVARPVIEEFFKVQRGRLVQKRLKAEYDDISRKKLKRAKAGKAGGEAKARKTKENVSSNASDLLGDTRAFPEPYPEPEEEEKPPTPKGEKRRKPRTAIPADFPDAEAIAEEQAKARSAGANVDATAQAERFRNHAAQNDRRCADWRAAWRNWMAGAVEKAPKTAIAALSARTAPPSPADRWDGVVREFRANGYWNRDDNGPPPGREGCRAPPSILALYGYATAAKHANDPQPQEAAA
jgi:uncharacterized protein YdaU (DUF1376 family)